MSGKKLLPVMTVMAFSGLLASAADRPIPIRPRPTVPPNFEVIQPNQPVPANARYFLLNGAPHLQFKDQEIVKLVPLTEFENPLTPAEQELVKAGPFFHGVKLGADHRRRFMPIRNQQSRGTCVAFASVAALESIFPYSTDLSEEYAYFMYKTRPGENCNVDGLKTTNSARYLTDNRIPDEASWAYDGSTWYNPHLSACQIETHQNPAAHLPPILAETKYQYQIGAYQLIGDNALGSNNDPARRTIDNIDYLIGILDQGYDIVAGFYVTGPDWVDDNINETTELIDATPGVDGCTIGGTCRGGHAMVIVGYNAVDEYLIVRNSWGSHFKDDGYIRLSYNYVRNYAKYGYYIKSAIRTIQSAGNESYRDEFELNSTVLARDYYALTSLRRYETDQFQVNRIGAISINVTRKGGSGILLVTLVKKQGETETRIAKQEMKALDGSVALRFIINKGNQGTYKVLVEQIQGRKAEGGKISVRYPHQNLR